MKQLLLTICFMFSIAGAKAQKNDVDYNKYPCKDAANCKAAEPDVLKVATILLDSEIDRAQLDRLNGSSFLLRWMEGTPDYKFLIDSNISLLGGDVDLTGIYFASLVKYTLENPALAEDNNAVKLGTWKLVANYVGNEAYNVKLTRKLKKLVEANNNNTLEKFLEE